MSGPSIKSKYIWQHINPMMLSALDEFKNWIKISKSDMMLLCHYRIENIAAVLYSYGHTFSIKVIDQIPSFLSKSFNKNTKIIRVGIEDIIVLISIEKDEDSATLIDNSLKNLRSFGVKNKSKPMFIQFKVGATLLTSKSSLEEKLDETYIALYEAISSLDKSFVIFDNHSDKMGSFKRSMQLAAEFQNILIKKSIRLAYQPVVNSKSGQIKNYEVLLRVLDENGNTKSAAEYIHVAENFGFIDQVDLLVLELAAKEVRNDKDVSLGINVSAMSIDNNKWLQTAKNLLKDPEIASRIIVEITETGFKNNLTSMQNFVDEIQSLGCQVAIDDFGSGYTSFTQLKTLRADILKIDGAFIKDIATNLDSQLFVKTLVNFAKAFGLKTVAEFVENGEVAKILIDIGIDYLQGHYFGKAVNYRPWINSEVA